MRPAHRVISGLLVLVFTVLFFSPPAFACQKPAEELAVLAVVPPTAFIVGPFYLLAWLVYKACRNAPVDSDNQKIEQETNNEGPYWIKKARGGDAQSQ